MCTVLLPPGVYPIAVKYIISYIISYHIISIISYQSYQSYHINHINHIISIISYQSYHINQSYLIISIISYQSYQSYIVSYIISIISYHIISIIYHINHIIYQSYHINHIISYIISIIYHIISYQSYHIPYHIISSHNIKRNPTTSCSLPLCVTWSPGYVWWGSGTRSGSSSSAAREEGSRRGVTYAGTPDCGKPRTGRTAPRAPCCCSSSEGAVSPRPLSSGLRSAGSCTGTAAQYETSRLPQHLDIRNRTFRGPRIVNVFQSMTNKMQRYTVFLFL